MRRQLSITFGIAFVTSTVAAQHRFDTSLSDRIDSYVANHIKNNDFAGVILIAKKDTVLFQKSYGKASASSPISVDTRFRISSITKTFTAALIYRLRDQGLLSLSDSISKFLPAYPGGNKITIEHLLRHRSGIPDFTDFPDFKQAMQRPMTLEEIVNWFKDKPLLFPPGSSNSYTNSGYTLLAYIAQKIKNQPFEQLIADQLLIPGGLTNTGIDHFADYGTNNNAEGFKIAGNHGLERVPPYYIENFIGCGFLASTAADVSKWTRLIISSKFFDVQKSPLYGWATRKYFGHDLIEQSGRTDGFIAYTSYFLKDGLMIIYLGNIESYVFNKMKLDLTAIYYGVPFDKPAYRKNISLSKKELAGWIGTYQLDANTTFTITEDHKRLKFSYNSSQTKHDLIPIKGSGAFLRLYGVTLVKNAEGIAWNSDDLKAECKKLNAPIP